MAEEGGIDNADVSHSRAFQYLSELQAEGKLTQAQVEYFKSKYAKLHEAVLQTYENEKNLLKNAKSLNLDLVEDRKRLEELQVPLHCGLLRQPLQNAQL
jgi:DNA integrity scanning protein DisA with diadenylate cyclase activity